MLLARQQLLFVCTCSLNMESQMKYYSAALFDEALLEMEALPSAGDTASGLLMMSAACILIALGAHPSNE